MAYYCEYLISLLVIASTYAAPESLSEQKNATLVPRQVKGANNDLKASSSSYSHQYSSWGGNNPGGYGLTITGVGAIEDRRDFDPNYNTLGGYDSSFKNAGYGSSGYGATGYGGIGSDGFKGQSGYGASGYSPTGYGPSGYSPTAFGTSGFGADGLGGTSGHFSNVGYGGVNDIYSGLGGANGGYTGGNGYSGYGGGNSGYSGYGGGNSGYSGYGGGNSGYGGYGGSSGIYSGFGSGNGGYGGYGGNGGLASYSGYNNPYYQGGGHLGYGYYNKKPGYGNIYSSGITPSLVTGYRGYSRR